MENQAEDAVKTRVRLGERSYALFERVRRGEGTYDETHFAAQLYRSYRRSRILPKFTDKTPPQVEGYFNQLVSEGWLVVYENEIADRLEAQFLKPEVKEEDTLSEDDEFETLEKGYALLEKRSSWKSHTLTPEELDASDALEEFERGERHLWALEGLVKDCYIRRTERSSGTRFEVA